MFVKDINGNIHSSCPRCQSNWIKPGEEVFACINDDCGMLACLHDKFTKLFFLCLEISSYTIYWQEDQCMIDKEGVKALDLPLLPFDIDEKKLKTYLIFS